ncbi:DNA repair protein RecN [Psychrosphaera aestuarii]|uniref:DNA repair protein RecN n=1 Tax=Psychrosphaera aestuarii TaxID=1266052 RepID=UPI001B32FC36|nr:DNA repair protein RecN [Psychrosphaera aestuarii]
MLVSIAIKNFAIVRQLEVNWHSAMTTITGETGAGKSIAIDALAQALGERCDAGMVRSGADKAEVIASFDIENLHTAKAWLKENDLLSDSDCILRRVISKEGRSKAYINGTPVPASQLKSLGSQLVSIHGQHAHTLLTKADYQRKLLDEYGDSEILAQQVSDAYRLWQNKGQELKELQLQQEEFSAQKQLLDYQVNELIEAELIADEYIEIEKEHQRLHHGQSLLADSLSALDILYESENGNAYSALQNAMSILSRAANIDEQLNPTVELINTAIIQLEEGASELRGYSDNLDINPERLNEIEQRLSTLVDLARKHQVEPNQLPEHLEILTAELESLSSTDERLDALVLEIEHAKAQYYELATKLSAIRAKNAAKLTTQITKSMQSLNMSGAKFELRVRSDQQAMAKFGFDSVEFLVCANQGQSLQPLAKVASGGELSRISLAIQVIIAEKVTTPTLLFDEVDVGVSGPTATAVGRLMKALSKNTQVICVTHLPQVASFGQQQQFVNKFNVKNVTETQMSLLSENERIEELARLLGGDIISDTTRANAKELLAVAQAA